MADLTMSIHLNEVSKSDINLLQIPKLNFSWNVDLQYIY